METMTLMTCGCVPGTYCRRHTLMVADLNRRFGGFPKAARGLSAPAYEGNGMNEDIDVERIAMVCHEVNRAYCASLGDDSQPAWNAAPEWQKDSAIAGVNAIIANPETTPAQSHEGWLAQKRADGWTYGPVKDAEKKEHPCFVPYDELPAAQRAKDYLFGAVVRAMAFAVPAAA